MWRKSIFGISLILITFPLPVHAFPNDSQIAQAAKRICNTPRNSSESLQSIFMRSRGRWLYDQTLSIEEARNEEKQKYLYDLVVQTAYGNCPVRTYEISNNYQFNIPESSK